jgi:regulation of enolase protein 1 (concanavalin A-like superfamily)
MPSLFSTPEDALRIDAGPRTDWFVDPETGAPRLDAVAVLRPVHGDFVLAAHVVVGFAATFDAGALALRHDDRTWAKVCFEYSPDGEAMIVSVVTHDASDDCNSAVVDGNAVWLRIARMGRACAFHYSTDGRRWHFVRHFRFVDDDVVDVGFLAQSPTGDGCSVTFSEITFTTKTLTSLRDGT